MRRALLLSLALLLCVAARADAELFLLADPSSSRGYVEVTVVATTDIKTVVIGERHQGVDEHIITTGVPYWRDHPDYGPVGATLVDRVVRWRCDRLERHLQVAGRRPDGIVEAAFYAVRTPSCRNRLTLTVPRRVGQGGVVRARIRDTWGTGLTSARVCFLGDCRKVGFADGQDLRVVRFRAGWRGLRKVTLRAPSQNLSEVIGVGVRPPRTARSGPTILATGDSLMGNVEAMLSDRLNGRAQVVSDVQGGTAISKPFILDWLEHARRQVARHEPNATAIFLGTNDSFPMETPAGDEIQCCGETWIAEYARRARRMMRTYAQGDTSMVLWFTVPAARDERRNPSAIAVNEGLRRAATGLPTVFVLPTDEVFTPGMRWRESMSYKGRVIRVRESDGVHLSIAGARIAASMAIDTLRDVGVLGRR